MQRPELAFAIPRPSVREMQSQVAHLARATRAKSAPDGGFTLNGSPARVDNVEDEWQAIRGFRPLAPARARPGGRALLARVRAGLRGARGVVVRARPDRGPAVRTRAAHVPDRHAARRPARLAGAGAARSLLRPPAQGRGLLEQRGARLRALRRR